MGVWNSHTSMGNIFGTLVASSFLGVEWTWSFVVPGIIIFVFGIIMFLFLIPEPADVGLQNPNSEVANVSTIDTNFPFML